MNYLKNITMMALGLFAFSAQAQMDFSQVQVQTTEVAEDLYMLVGAGGNLSLSVGDDGAFLVDDQYAPMSDKILAAIAEVTDQDIRFLINTHFHGDHTGGNENIGATGALIVAHENVRQRLSTDQFRAIFNQTIPASPEGALPVVTFSEEINFYWNDTEVRIFHVENAHTDGDAIVTYPEKNIIHMGDVFFNGFYPFVDVSSEGTLDGYIRAVSQVLSLPFVNDDTRIIPGHGPLATPADLETYLNMMMTARNRINALILQQLSEDEVVARDPMSDYHEQWGGGFMSGENFTRLAYQSLAHTH